MSCAQAFQVLRSSSSSFASRHVARASVNAAASRGIARARWYSSAGTAESSKAEGKEAEKDEVTITPERELLDSLKKKEEEVTDLKVRVIAHNIYTS